ncbi:malectin domain-containing carbohydrate-binding protein [Pontibacter pamirensis]|uniref:malectin domain-containing carbohydrate-binding protein n=1 Tax=Pontibacter pamirensis TaxID=2562824 RepID=UPI00138A0AF7|nr:malectin domain-containing carbohydrate-binding protein [Pontibacter pamirensis]
MKEITTILHQKPISGLANFCSLLLLCLLLLSPDFAHAQWTRKQDAFKKRSEVTSVIYKEKLYTFMGFGTFPEVESSSEVYDPVQGKWTLLASMPAGKTVTHQGVVLIDDKVWHIGGRVGTNPGPLTSEIWIYDITNNSWHSGPQLIDPANGKPLLWAGGGAALVGRRLHVFGGFVTSACDSDQDKYHLTLDIDKWLNSPKTTQWENKLTPMPTKRNHFGTTVLGGKIYALGGQFGHDCGGGSDQKYSHMYNPITDTWTKLTDMPTPRSHIEGSTFPLDGKIYIVAGQGTYGANQDRVTIFTPEANGGLGSWADATAYTLPNEYEGIASKVIGNTFIISHGGQGNSTNTQKTAYTSSITRNIPYKFGFTEECFTRTVESNQKLVLKNLLFTLEKEKQYTLSSNAKWLSVTKNATGVAVQSAVEVEVTIDATGLDPGTYTATVTATGTGAGPSFSGAAFCVKLTVRGTQNAVLVNSGGSGYTDSGGRVWGADAHFTGGVTSSKSFDVAGTTDDQLYLKYRYAKNGAPFSYNIPVSEAGSYTVKLHFVEPYFKESGARKFHVDVEGQRVISNYDLWAQQGYGKALVMTFDGISVTDGTANILLTSVTNNAIISGVELIKSPSAPTLALNVGGAEHTDSEGRIWAADAYYSSGVTSTKSFDVAGTTNDQLYLKYRFASSGAPFTYSIPVSEAGSYTVKLHFVEPYFKASGARKFNVDLEGQRVISNIDLYAQYGFGIAVVLTYEGVSVTDGTLNILFTSVTDNAVISGIEMKQNTSATASIIAQEMFRGDTSLKVYPNPNAGDMLFVEVSGHTANEAITTSIYDVTGRVIHAEASIANERGNFHLELPLGKRLQKGLYLVQTQGLSGKRQARLVVQ